MEVSQSTDISVQEYDFSGSPFTLQVWYTCNGQQLHKTLDVDTVLNFLWKIGKYEPSELTPILFFNGPSLRGRAFRCQQIARYLHHEATGAWPDTYNPLAETPTPAPGTAAYSSLMGGRFNDHTGFGHNQAAA